MAKIQIKRGQQEAVERLTLAQGEFGLALDTGNLYIGTTTGNLHVNPKVSTVGTADKLTTPRNISATGDATAAAVAFDGSADVTLQLVLANLAGLTAGTYSKVTVNEKGQVTAGGQLELSDIAGIGGTEAGNVPVLQDDGKLLASILPDLAGTYIPVGKIGAAGGVAQLDEQGKVPISQLPSYVSDIVEADSQSAFPEAGESNKIYVAKDTNLTYRWGGTGYVEISQSLALGETSATAFAGDKGKAAYDHLSTVATADTAGHVKPGVGMSIAADGTLTIDSIDGGTFE